MPQVYASGSAFGRIIVAQLILSIVILGNNVNMDPRKRGQWQHNFLIFSNPHIKTGRATR